MENKKEEIKIDNSFSFAHSPEYVDKQIATINSMLSTRNYSLLNNVHTLSGQLHRPRQLSREQIRKAVLSPYSNVDLLQQASMLLKATNGIYKKVLNYQSTILTNDHMIYPVSLDKIDSAETMNKVYNEVATYLDKFDVKNTACWIYERVLEQGELYLYKLKDAKGIVMQEIPNTLCKITSIDNGIQKYGINLSKLNDEVVLSMPQEIQNLYLKKKSGLLKEDEFVDRVYYELKDNNAIAFNMDRFATKGIPFFATAFDDLMELEDMKDLKSENAVIESIKLIHQKLPIDSETGVVLMDFDVAKAYHNATKQNLPKGTSITTNPLDLKAVTLADGSSKINQSVSQSLDNIYDTLGINNELFNGSKSTNEAIATGIVADGLLTKRLQMMVENWLNFELTQFKKGGTTWRIKFIDTTHFDRVERSTKAREDMAYGGSRTEFLATKGYTPLQGRNVLRMERLLDLDSLMIPQQTSHTSTGEVSEDDNGRPEKDASNSDGLSTEPEVQ